MVDGFKIAETIKKENKEIYEILSNVEVPGNYIGDGVFLEARRPIFKMNSDNELIQVSFNNYDLSLIHISEPTRLLSIGDGGLCL